MRKLPLLFALGTISVGIAAEPAPAKPLYAEDFTDGLGNWVVEQQPGGTVTIEHGKLVIADAAGCTVWFRPQLKAPLVISYEATMSSASRVSDLNCFWLASEPGDPGEAPFTLRHARDGKFASYDSLLTYYVGYGGNTNRTTPFRRYDGHGARPLLPEHDLSAPAMMLIPDHTYHIRILVTNDGRIRFYRDGDPIFDWRDPAPLTAGWFAFRTVHSRMEISHFRVSRPE